jgi:hypothetical protein
VRQVLLQPGGVCGGQGQTCSARSMRVRVSSSSCVHAVLVGVESRFGLRTMGTGRPWACSLSDEAVELNRSNLRIVGVYLIDLVLGVVHVDRTGNNETRRANWRKQEESIMMSVFIGVYKSANNGARVTTYRSTISKLVVVR